MHGVSCELFPREIFPMIILNAKKEDFAVVHRLALTSSWQAAWVRQNADKIADHFVTKYTCITNCPDALTPTKRTESLLPNGLRHGEIVMEHQKNVLLTVINSENFRLGKQHGRSSYKSNFSENVHYWINGARSSISFARAGLTTRNPLTINIKKYLDPTHRIYVTIYVINEQYTDLNISTKRVKSTITEQFVYPVENLPDDKENLWLEWFEKNIEEIMRHAPR